MEWNEHKLYAPVSHLDAVSYIYIYARSGLAVYTVMENIYICFKTNYLVCLMVDKKPEELHE